MITKITAGFAPKNYAREKEFQADYLKWLKNSGCFVYKLTDASMGFKPYDAIVVTPNGETLHMELKITYDWLRWNDVRPNQHAALRHVTDLGARAVIVCYGTETHNVLVVDYKDFTRVGIYV